MFSSEVSEIFQILKSKLQYSILDYFLCS